MWFRNAREEICAARCDLTVQDHWFLWRKWYSFSRKQLYKHQATKVQHSATFPLPKKSLSWQQERHLFNTAKRARAHSKLRRKLEEVCDLKENQEVQFIFERAIMALMVQMQWWMLQTNGIYASFLELLSLKKKIHFISEKHLLFFFIYMFKHGGCISDWDCPTCGKSGQRPAWPKHTDSC